MKLTYREVMPWIVGTNNLELLQLMKVCMVGMLDDGFNADYSKLLLVDGYFVGASYNTLVTHIKSDSIVGFGSSHVRDLIALLKDGLAPLEAVKIMKASGLINVLEQKTINTTCINILRAICKRVIIDEYNQAHKLEN
jgi:hypothetical protein